MCRLIHIPLERKCVREDQSVGIIFMIPVSYPIFYITAYAWALSHTFSLQWDMPELSGHPKSASQRWLVLGVRGSEEKIRFYSSSDVDCPQNALMWIYSGDYGKTKYAKELELLGLSSGDRASSKNFQ